MTIAELEKEIRAEERREHTFREDVTRDIEELIKSSHRIERRLREDVSNAREVPEAQAYSILFHRVARVFVFAWTASFIPLVSGLGAFPNMDTARAAAWSAVAAALAAVLKVLQASVTKDEEPFLGTGFVEGIEPTTTRTTTAR